MGIVRRKFITDPYQRFGGVDSHICVDIVDDDHCPDNKRRGQFSSSRCVIKFTRCADADGKTAWIEVESTETTTSLKGHTQTRTTSMTIGPEIAEQLVAFLTTGNKE